MDAGAGDPDVQQAPLLLDLLVGLGVGDRHHALGQADQEHGVPFEALRGVQRRQGHPLDRRGVLGGRPFVELADQVGQGRPRFRRLEVLGEAHQRGQRLPAVAHGARSGGRAGGPALGGEHRPHLGGQVLRPVEQGVVAPGAGRAAQGGARLADLGPFEEPLGAAELVGHPCVREGLLVDLGLGVDPVEHGDLAGRYARGDEVADAPGGGLGLGGLVPVLRVDRLGTLVALGDQLQTVVGGLAVGLAQEAVGEVDDLGGGAVVPDQLDDGRPGVAGAEVQQVVGGGPGEGVDRLAGVADDAEVVPVADPEVEQPLLERADVLVLVDDEVLVLAAHVVGDVSPVLEDADHQQQHVLEVDHRAVALELFVRGVDLGEDRRVAGGVPLGLGDGRRVVGGDGLGDLGPLDLAGDVPQLGAVEPELAAGGRLGDQLHLPLQQPGQLATDCFRPEILELPERGGVEGPRLDAGRAELAEAAAHLSGGPVGERDGEHRGGLEDARPHPVRDAVGDRAGLARTRSGQHAHRSVQGERNLALLGVEPVEHGVRGLGYLREEGGVRCCCHPAMLPGPRGRMRRSSTGVSH
ncbi:hypothetical protein P376_5701 [Streptomyces sp. HCCB10043]|nr:hypothetical protein P376_5701 [Streptomyces sp. HCCB10043]